MFSSFFSFFQVEFATEMREILLGKMGPLDEGKSSGTEGNFGENPIFREIKQYSGGSLQYKKGQWQYNWGIWQFSTILSNLELTGEIAAEACEEAKRLVEEKGGEVSSLVISDLLGQLLLKSGRYADVATAVRLAEEWEGRVDLDVSLYRRLILRLAELAEYNWALEFGRRAQRKGIEVTADVREALEVSRKAVEERRRGKLSGRRKEKGGESEQKVWGESGPTAEQVLAMWSLD